MASLLAAACARVRAVPPCASVSAEVFGHRVNASGARSGWKVLKRLRRGPAMLDYYAQRTAGRFESHRSPFVQNIRLLQNRERIEDRMKRGKLPTKKGEGKRAMKSGGKAKAGAGAAERKPASTVPLSKKRGRHFYPGKLRWMARGQARAAPWKNDFVEGSV